MKISSHELHLWFIDPNTFNASAELAFCFSLLNDKEQEQQQRFYFEKDRQLYLVTRAALRIILSCYHPDIRPQHWLFQRTPAGKPYLDKAQSALFFNLSHTEGMIIIALGESDNIGVDVESCSRQNINLALMASYLSPLETELLNTLAPEEQLPYFLRAWTMKEAYSKAIGTGLSSLNNLIYHINKEGGLDVPKWQFWEMTPHGNYYVALAANCGLVEKIDVVSMYQLMSVDNFQPVCFSIDPITHVTIA